MLASVGVISTYVLIKCCDKAGAVRGRMLSKVEIIREKMRK